MSKEDSTRISLLKRMALYERYILLARVAEKYANDKSVLRAMRKIAHNERKGLQTSRYPMETKDIQEALILIGELHGILNSLVRASGYDRYRLASEALTEFLEKLEKEYGETENKVQGKASAKDTIDAAIDKAKTIGEVIGKGVEEIKKTVKDLGSK